MDDYVERLLHYVTDAGGLEQVVDSALSALGRSLVVLGEPGMGKTRLLRRLGEQPGHVFRSAASFVASPDPQKLAAGGQTLVIDGLDELSASSESDPVYRVLGQLIKAGCPPFILSCRAADWRGAVARQDIAEEYGIPPLELSLEPFSDREATAYLTPALGAGRAAEVVKYLHDNGIPDLFGNPLTLKLFGEVAAKRDTLPETRAELMRAATEIMWSERNDRHDGSILASMDSHTALMAAGAASAAYVLTGSETIGLKPSSVGQDGVLPVAEIQGLPDGDVARALIGSRLFQRVADGEDQFKPVHRSVAEYLGARWLAATARDALARERVLAMMTIDDGVPASLRGIHAWLAQDDHFAARVIETDPYGVLRYGDPDALSVSQGRALLKALKGLEKTNPYFRAEDWGRHSAKGLAQIELLDDVRAILLAKDTNFHLRTLLLGAIKGSRLAAALAGDLRGITADNSGTYSYDERREAAEAFITLDTVPQDWPAFIETLVDMGGEDATRLALELMDDVGFESLGGALVGKAILAYLGLLDDPTVEEAERTNVGTLYLTARQIPDSMLGPVLDALAAHMPRADLDSDYRSRAELADTATRLIARQLAIAPPDPLVLLTWLRIAPTRHGYAREDQEALARFLAEFPDVRRAIQRQVILHETEHETSWGRIWRLAHFNPALSLEPEDVVWFLSEMDGSTAHDAVTMEGWRDLAAFARRTEGAAPSIIAAATPYAKGYPELEQFLENLQKPLPTPEWQIEQQTRQTKRAQEQAEAFLARHKSFGENEALLRAGELGWVHPVAYAYLAMYHDIEKKLPPVERVSEFLGEDLVEAALAGLEASLRRGDLPTSRQIADSYAQSRRWNFVYPLMAAVTERVLKGRDLEDLPLDVVLSVRLSFEHEHLGDRVAERTVVTALEARLRRDPGDYEQYIRLLIEPSLDAKRDHIIGLYGFVRSAADRALATRLAAEWLQKYDALPATAEAELVDVLADTHNFDVLRKVAAERDLARHADDKRRRNWQATALLCDFEAARAQLEPVPAADRELLWAIRHRIGGARFEERPSAHGEPKLLAWVITQFRSLWENRSRPTGVTGGDTNDFDATEVLGNYINRLAVDTSPEAVAALEGLVAAPEDGYTPQLLYAFDQQRKARREIAFPKISLDRLKTTIAAQQPATSDDLLAILRHSLAQVQLELRGNETDSIVKYWRDDGQPRNEDRCTDALAEDLARHLPDLGVRRIPQADMPNGKIADLLYEAGQAALPIEAKGQWNAKLWSAASDQLDDFYLRDWRVQDRGIYLVYWFGPEVAANFRLKAPPPGIPKPETPEALRLALTNAIPLARRASILVEVLDLTR